MNDVKLRNLIELYTDAFQNRLQYVNQKFNLGITERHATISYNGVPFEVLEASGADIVSGEYINRIFIDVPRTIMKEGGLQVSWRTGNSRTEAVDLRKRACYDLAKMFVTEVLPKVDFEIEKVVYEHNIDKILSVLN